MKALVSRSSRWPLFSNSCSFSSGPPGRGLTPPFVAKLANIGVHLLHRLPVEAASAAGVVAHPVFGTGTQHQPVALAGHGQAVAGAEPQLTQEMGRQSYLVLAAYGGHSWVLPAVHDIAYDRLVYFTMATLPWQVHHILYFWSRLWARPYIGVGATLDGESAVDRLEDGLRRRDDDVRVGAAAGVSPALALDADDDLTDRVDPLRHALDRELRQLVVDADESVDRLVGGVHRAGARRCVDKRPAVLRSEADGCRRHELVPAGDLKEIQVEGFLFLRPALIGQQHLQVAVVDLRLLVGEVFEGGERALELLLRQLVAEVVQAGLEAVSPRQLAEDDLAAGRPADLAGVHDLVGLAHLEDAVLVDAGLVAEGVGTDDRLIRLH